MNYKIVIVHIKVYIGIIVAIVMKIYKTPHTHLTDFCQTASSRKFQWGVLTETGQQWQREGSCVAYID